MIVQAFPHIPDAVALVNALAEEEGEPSAEAIQAAAHVQADAHQGGCLTMLYTSFAGELQNVGAYMLYLTYIL